MAADLTSREDAIRWLQERGLYAAARNWTFDDDLPCEGIIAAASKTGSGSEIPVLDHVVCLGLKQGQWHVFDLLSKDPNLSIMRSCA